MLQIGNTMIMRCLKLDLAQLALKTDTTFSVSWQAKYLVGEDAVLRFVLAAAG